MKRCVVIGAAPGCDPSFIQNSVSSEDYIICADAGYLLAQQAGIQPDICLGDFDTAPAPKGTKELIVLPAEKDDTDLAFSLKEGIRRGFRSFLLLNVLGGRIDHTLANLQLMRDLSLKGYEVAIRDPKAYLFAFCQGKRLIRREGYRYISLFSLTSETQGITLEGFVYPLCNATLTDRVPLGVSNEFVEEEGSIFVQKGCLLVALVKE